MPARIYEKLSGTKLMLFPKGSDPQICIENEKGRKSISIHALGHNAFEVAAKVLDLQIKEVKNSEDKIMCRWVTLLTRKKGEITFFE